MAVENYENLKENVIKECGPRDLEILKEICKKDVCSKRTLNRLQSVSQLISVLEERDCVSRENVSYFDVFADELKRPKISELVRTYKKLYCTEPVQCTVCCKDLSGETEPLLSEVVVERSPAPSYSVDAQPYYPHGNCNNSTALNHALEEAIDILSCKLQGSWPVLARHLDVTEKQIQAIRKLYPGDHCQQARKVLLLWKTEKKQAATFEALVSALNERLPKMKGLGSHLLQRRVDPLY